MFVKLQPWFTTLPKSKLLLDVYQNIVSKHSLPIPSPLVSALWVPGGWLNVDAPGQKPESGSTPSPQSFDVFKIEK